MTDAMREAFRERMASAIRFFAAAPDDSTARRELASLLAYGSGAVALFNDVLNELSGDGSIGRASLTSLKAFVTHVQRTSTQHAVSAAWLDVPPDHGQVDETILRGADSEPVAEPPEAEISEDRQAPQGSNNSEDLDPLPAQPEPEPPGTELPAGTVCAERYEIVEPIAVGGMSTVYRAVDNRNGQTVALKVLRSTLVDDLDMVEAFAREADNAWALNHRGFVQVLAQGWIGPQPFLALEYLDGQSLSAAMRREFATGAPWPVARRILTRIGSAIAHAHRRGLVHADLKPGNIFLLKNGDPRILDLGAAQIVHGDAPVDDERDRDTSGSALTPAYASPEMLLGASAEARDDIFSLAVIGYELVAGRHPFDRYTADRARHLDLLPVRPVGIPPYAWRTLRRGLALRRDRRQARMRAFVAGLRTPFPIATTAAATLLLAIMLGTGIWAHYHHEEARRHWATAGDAADLAIELLALRPLPERPHDSLAVADALAATLGWEAPRNILVRRLSERLEPEPLKAADSAALERATGAIVTLRGAAYQAVDLSEPTLVVTRAVLARLSELILRASPLPVDQVSRMLELLHEVDPDGIRVIATHLTDLLNERRHTLDSDAARADFDRLAGELVQRFPIVPPPVSGPTGPAPAATDPGRPIGLPDGR